MNRTFIGTFLKFIGVVCIFAALILVVALLSGSFRSERKAQRINCVSNLKQIGIAFRLWEGDHSDQYPFNVSTNIGGTMELCAADKDGFDRNAYLHLRAMNNELTTPKLLVCPQDRSKKAASDFGNLGPANISYRFRSGTNVAESNPREILAVCPVHGNILYCDGSVIEVKTKPGPGIWDELGELVRFDEKFQMGLAFTSTVLAAGLGLLWLGIRLKVKRGKAGGSIAPTNAP